MALRNALAAAQASLRNVAADFTVKRIDAVSLVFVFGIRAGRRYDKRTMMRRGFVGLTLMALTLWAVGACTSSDDSTGSNVDPAPSPTTSSTTDADAVPPGVQVGPEGSTFTLNGVVVTIPPGAVSTSTTINVTEDSTTPPGYVVDGKVYRFSPTGLHFAVPVTITLPAQPAAKTIYWSLDGNENAYESLPTTYDTAGATTKISHFSSGFVGTSSTGVTCVTKTAVMADTAPGNCITTMLVESPKFWFTTYDGAPSGDAKAAIETDSAGLKSLLADYDPVPRFYANASHSVYKSKYCCGDWGTANVSSNNLTSFTADGKRDTIDPNSTQCRDANNQYMPELTVQCSGGGLTIGDGSSPSDAGADDASTDASPGDAGTDAGVDDASTDAGPGDAGTDAGVCLGTATIDPYSSSDVTPVNLPPYSFGCGPLASHPTARIVEFTKPVNFTLWQNHMLLSDNSATSHLRAGCDGTSTDIASHSYDCRTSTVTSLSPGRYTFIACDSTGAFIAEPVPVGVNANTSCGTASPAGPSSHRVYDATTKLYFQYTPTFSGTFRIQVSSPQTIPMRVGLVRAELQTTCDDRATDLIDTGPTTDPQTASLCTDNGSMTSSGTASLVGGTTYWIVLSEMSSGMQPGATLVGP